MKAKLLGLRKLDFTADDKSSVKGCQLFISYPEEGVEGEQTDKLFIRDGFDLPALKPGDTLEITFNRKGRPESIRNTAAKQVNVPN